MKKVIVFGASNSKYSINQQLAIYAGSQLKGVSVKDLELDRFEMPIYSIDKEQENGVPDLAEVFNNVMGLADGFIVSFAEHNGAYSTAFKNIFDWVSRVNPKMWYDKPVLFLATSPGARGGQTVLEIAKGRMPYHGANIVGSFSFPSFGENFNDGKIVDTKLNDELASLIQKFEKEL